MNDYSYYKQQGDKQLSIVSSLFLKKYRQHIKTISRMLNCQKAKRIDIHSYLEKNGNKAIKRNKNTAWHLSPFRNEKTPSFKVDLTKNLWIDFGTGEGGTIIDLIIKINDCSVSEALRILNSKTFPFHQQHPLQLETKTTPKYEITKVDKIINLNLNSYLKTRKLNLDFSERFCFQVHYTFNKKKEFYGIGFLNNSGGFEIRNKYFKGCLGVKDITTFNNNSEVLSMFEGFMDFLSYLTYLKSIPNENFMILNSTALVKKTIGLITDFKVIKTFFDNDYSGEKVTKIIQENSKNEFEDCRIIYKNYKDFNEYLTFN